MRVPGRISRHDQKLLDSGIEDKTAVKEVTGVGNLP